MLIFRPPFIDPFSFQIAASFAVIYVYAGELMPTVVRSEAMGISSFVAGLGLLMFPYVNALVRTPKTTLTLKGFLMNKKKMSKDPLQTLEAWMSYYINP